MSAASPIYRGYLSDIDTRWTVISQSVDDNIDSDSDVMVRSQSLDLHDCFMIYIYALSLHVCVV